MLRVPQQDTALCNAFKRRGRRTYFDYAQYDTLFNLPNTY
jgi:hypothetical protein